jgi:hypothetical protein
MPLMYGYEIHQTMAEGDIDEANFNTSTNNLPAICGGVSPHQTQ